MSNRLFFRRAPEPATTFWEAPEPPEESVEPIDPLANNEAILSAMRFEALGSAAPALSPDNPVLSRELARVALQTLCQRHIAELAERWGIDNTPKGLKYRVVRSIYAYKFLQLAPKSPGAKILPTQPKEGL